MRKVLITGGNKGIGFEATKIFIDHDFEVVVIGRDFSSFNLSSPKIKKVAFDLKATERIPQLAKEVGDVDVLINNAGMMNSLPFDNYPDSKKEELMRINIEAPVVFIREFSRGMIEKGYGRIVNVASIAGEIGHPDIWYGDSKDGFWRNFV